MENKTMKSEKTYPDNILVVKKQNHIHFSDARGVYAIVKILAPRKYRGRFARITWGMSAVERDVEKFGHALWATGDRADHPTGWDGEKSVRWFERVIELSLF